MSKSLNIQTNDFDSWFDSVNLNMEFWESPMVAARLFYNAGQQSKQEEIDRLNEALKYMMEQIDHPYRTSGEKLEKNVHNILKKK